MNNRSVRRRRIALTVLGVVVVALLVLHARYPLPYVYRVLVFQDADFADIHRFPASSIGSASLPSELPVAIDRRVAGLVEQHPQVDDFDAFLEATETTAFLVVHRGELIEERYLLGHDAESMQNTFSVSKSVTSALVGLAVRDGVMNLESPITRWLPELGERDARFAQITIEDLLDMRSGIRFSSEVDFPFVHADNPHIYYHPDLESVLLNRTEIDGPPGEFQYNNYHPPLLGLALRRATGVTASEYLGQEIWRPLGAAAPAGWTVDEHGLERMESGFHARGRDLARFGLLYLSDGFAGEREVVPSEWVLASTRLSEAAELETFDGRQWGYRAGWWIVPRPSGREDYCAIGRYGQFIYVSPQHSAVFVRNGPGRGDWGDRDWTELFYSLAERL